MIAFGIASLIFSVIAIFIPGFGIMISGLSGFLAWLSTGKGAPLGVAAVIINCINIFLMSPVYMVAAAIEASRRTDEQSRLFTIWAIVLFFQIAAVVVFVFNFIVDKTQKNDGGGKEVNRPRGNDFISSRDNFTSFNNQLAPSEGTERTRKYLWKNKIKHTALLAIMLVVGFGMFYFRANLSQLLIATKEHLTHQGKPTFCSEMASCEEAKFYQSNCPGTIIDGDGDGVPCESQWCGHN